MVEIQENWIERLSGEESVRDVAIEELRAILLRGLSHSMSNRYRGVVQAADVVQDALLKILSSRFAGRTAS
jgi:DNA-directed RNA polymerase specialized sigma24 family protein